RLLLCSEQARRLLYGKPKTLADFGPKGYPTPAVAILVPAREAIIMQPPTEPALSLLADALAPERNPAVQVADRASAIRITGLRAFWVNPVVYLRIETNQGVVGWGDLKGVDPRPAKALVESLYELLDRENPTRIEYPW